MPWDDRIGRRLRLRDLQTLIAVVDSGGVGKAADRLNYSQPAVSKAIANLERTFGRRLLERNRKGIELTPYGDALLRCGAAMLDDLRKGVADLDFLSDPTVGQIRVGCTEPVSAGIVSEVASRIAKRHPRISFEFLVRDRAMLFRELTARNIDAVIAQVEQPFDQNRLQCEILYDERLAVVAGARHPCARKRRVTLADLIGLPWALPPRNSYISLLFAEAFRADGLAPPSTAVTAPAFLRLMMTVRGDFLTVVPAVMLREGLFRSSLRALPIELSLNCRRVGLVTLRDRPVSPVAQLFVEHARSLAKAMSRD